MAGLKYGEVILGIGPNHVRSLLKLGEGKVFKMEVPHSEIVATESALVSLKGNVFRRPTLGEYTTLMDRVPTPSYPKDIMAILGMLDVHHNSCVMEAGSGSGALTLHLSRAVGASGQVYSFETVPRHLKMARHNYKKWRASWEVGQESEWPDNVTFMQEDVKEAGNYITRPVDCVSLDVADPGPLLGHLLPTLRPSTPISVYLANLSQFITLCKIIQQEQLNVVLERIVEVGYREWMVKPVTSKSSRLHTTFFEDKFICRPSFHQMPHSGFIGLLRCFENAQLLPQMNIVPTDNADEMGPQEEESTSAEPSHADNGDGTVTSSAEDGTRTIPSPTENETSSVPSSAEHGTVSC